MSFKSQTLSTPTAASENLITISVTNERHVPCGRRGAAFSQEVNPMGSIRRISRAIIRRAAKVVLVPPLIWCARNMRASGGDKRPVFFDIHETAPALER